MTDATNLSQFRVRFIRQMPQDLARAASSGAVQRLIEQAWDNGWRDPDWLATTALLGTSNDRIENAAALFAHQLRNSADTPCPIDDTPIPPPIAHVRATLNAGHQPTSEPSAWANRIRKAISR